MLSVIFPDSAPVREAAVGFPIAFRRDVAIRTQSSLSVFGTPAEWLRAVSTSSLAVPYAHAARPRPIGLPLW